MMYLVCVCGINVFRHVVRFENADLGKYRICRSISRSYSTNSSPPFRGVRLIYRMRRFSWTISCTNLVPRHSLVPTRGRVRVGTSECLGTRDISRRGHIWSTWNIAAFHCEVSKEL